MMRVCRISMVMICFVLSSVSWATAAQELPKDKVSDQARAAYNAGQFKQAVSLFKSLTFKYPTSPSIYRALAASANNAKRFDVAVRAYTIYLSLAATGSDADKARAELRNVQQQLKSSKTGLKNQKELTRLEKAFNQATQAKILVGKQGGMNLLRKMLKLGFFGPKFQVYHQVLLKGIDQRLEALLTAYWSVENTVDAEAIIELQTLSKSAKAIHLNAARINRVSAIVDALSTWNNGEHKKALAQLEQLEQREYRIRYLQANLLLKAKRFKESESLFRSLFEQFHHPRMLLRAEQIKLANIRRMKSEHLDAVVELLDTMPLK
jgi:outer membrane protein assembly factor BamD (BamD/ComL family)